MHKFILGYSQEAKESIDNFPAGNLKSIAKRTFEQLVENPFRGKKLVGKLTGLYSIRITRKYRAIYQINLSQRTIIILDVSHRKESYR